MLTDNLQITTITIDASCANISFNEKELNDTVIAKLNFIVFNDDKILKISSNFIDPDIISDELSQKIKLKEEEIVLNSNVKKRGRKKKDITQYFVQQRKKQGTGKHFNSQITFMIKSFVIPGKIYNIKLFRTGSIGVPGINDLKDINEVLIYLVDKLKYVFDSDLLLLSTITPKMINYKTFFVIPNDYILNYNRLKNILNDKHKDILYMPITIQKDKNNCLSIRPMYIDESGKKKQYLIEMFLSGKTNIKGLYPHNIMINHLKIIERYLSDETYCVLLKKHTNPDDILKLLNSCSSTEIEYIF
jgi:hypothetical protein